MSTLVCFHAHPDDEAISTGGLMVKAAAAGHRVVLVTATRGEQGDPQGGVLDEGEELWERRLVELAASAKILGADEPILLGYEDSGMIGEPANDNPACFWQADQDEAAERLAKILRDVDADVLTIYDNHGGYGHPDHIRVHTVGRKAAELAGVSNVFEATMNRDRIMSRMEAMLEAMPADSEDAPNPEDFKTFGTLEADMSFHVDVSDQIDTKREALIVHRSQVGPDSFFLTMPPEAFVATFGSEWFNIPDKTATGGPALVDLLPGLD